MPWAYFRKPLAAPASGSREPRSLDDKHLRPVPWHRCTRDSRPQSPDPQLSAPTVRRWRTALTHPIEYRCRDSRLPANFAAAIARLSLLAMAWACLIQTSRVHAQIIYANPIPNDLKISPNTLNASQIAVISNFVDAEIANLKSGKSESEKAAARPWKTRPRPSVIPRLPHRI